MPAGDIADGTTSDTTRFIEEAAGGSEAERRSWRPCAEARALRCQFRRKISFR